MPTLNLKAVLGFDGKGFEMGMAKADSTAKKLSSSFTGTVKGAIAGAFTVGAITALANKTLDYAGEINDLSQRLGVSTETLQEFDYAAKQNGTTLAAFTSFMERLGTEREKALEGNQDVIDQFEKLGVSIDDLKSKRVDQLTQQIAAKVKNSDIQAIIAPLREIGGRGAGDLVASFRAGLEEAGQAAREANAIISDDVIAQLDDIGDRFSSIGQQITAGLAPALSFLSTSIQAFIDEVKRKARQLGAFAGEAGPVKTFVDAMPFAGIPIALQKQRENGKFSPGEFLKDSLIGTLPLGGLILDLQKSKASQKAKEDFDAEVVKREEDAIKAREARTQASRAVTFEQKEKSPEKEKPEPVSRVKGIESGDSLARVGNFLGGGANTITGIAQKQLDYLKVIARNTGQRQQSGGSLSQNTPPV